MIQINLVPDVKQELITAQRVRTSVVTGAILVALAAAALIVVMALYVFGGQTIRGAILDGNIDSEQEKIAAVPDLANTLTIQNQLTKLDETHSNKTISSRLLDMLTTVNPDKPNNIKTSTVSLDTESSTVTIEAQASRGYSALEVYKKTISATNVEFEQDGQTEAYPLASNLQVTDTSYGQDASGKRVLRFTLTFEYPVELFAYSSKNARIAGPHVQNVTDSYIRIPQSLFGDRADDLKEAE